MVQFIKTINFVISKASEPTCSRTLSSAPLSLRGGGEGTGTLRLKTTSKWVL